MHAKAGLRVVLKWRIARSGSVVAAVMSSSQTELKLYRFKYQRLLDVVRGVRRLRVFLRSTESALNDLLERLRAND